MTAAEVCEKYDISESSLKSNFARTNKGLLKKYNIKLEKKGRGNKAVYTEIRMNDERAVTIFQEARTELMVYADAFKFINWEFAAFFGIIVTPHRMFRGTYAEFLEYNGINKTRENVEKIKEALTNLQNRGYIKYDIDEDYIILYIRRKVEKEFKIELDMVDDCRILAEKNHKRSWIPILKTWVAIDILVNEQPFKQERICEMTGMSAYTVRESMKILEGSKIFKSSKAYTGYLTCIGTNVDLNNEAFYLI